MLHIFVVLLTYEAQAQGRQIVSTLCPRNNRPGVLATPQALQHPKSTCDSTPRLRPPPHSPPYPCFSRAQLATIAGNKASSLSQNLDVSLDVFMPSPTLNLVSRCAPLSSCKTGGVNFKSPHDKSNFVVQLLPFHRAAKTCRLRLLL